MGLTMRFLTQNVKSMGNLVFEHLKHLKTDFVFLQENHMRTKHQSCFKCAWVSQIFQSTFSSKARGVAVLIGKNIEFSFTNVINDMNGRYLIVSDVLFHRPVML